LASTGAAGIWTRSLLLWPASLGDAKDTALRSTNAAVSCCAVASAWRWAVRLVSEVRKWELSQTAITQQAALAAFEASGQGCRAAAVLEELNEASAALRRAEHITKGLFEAGGSRSCRSFIA
ncbi:Rpl30, partial [Symbiodinium sp. KB8]